LNPLCHRERSEAISYLPIEGNRFDPFRVLRDRWRSLATTPVTLK